MKKLIIGLLAAALLTACQSASTPFLTATTNAVPTITTTNQAVVTTTTSTPPGATQPIQVTVTNWQTVMVTNWQTNIVFQPSGTVSTVLSTVEAANTVTGPFNPFSGAIAAALGLLSAGLGFYARQKTIQANTHAGVAATVINAVEGLAAPVGDAVKAAVTAQSLKQGTATAVNDAVQTLTSGLSK
jgi:hypothetical protein